MSSPRECADRIVCLLQDARLRARIGQEAKQSVRRNFLLPRLALDYLKVAKPHLSKPTAVPG